MEGDQMKQAEMFVKVTYKGNTFNFGKGIQEYHQLLEATKIRFPQLKDFTFFFKEQPITQLNFGTLIKLQSLQGQKSIKLQLRESSFEQQKVEMPPPKTKKYSFNPSEFDNKSKKYSFNAEEFDNSTENKRKESLSEEFQVLSLNEKKQKQETDSIDQSKINIKALISEEFQCIQPKLNEQYFWKFNLVNLSGFDIKDKLFIKDYSTKKLIQINNFKNSQNRQVLFGPYLAKQLGKYTHLYQIIYKKNEQKSLSIGEKFGFAIDTKKKILIKEVENKVVQRINKVKSFCVCQKTTEYIVNVLKELKITDASIDGFNDNDLIDLIESIDMK